MCEEKQEIKSFNSFEEMENEKFIRFAALSPDEALFNLKLISLASMGFSGEDELKEPDRIIYFDKE